MTTKSIDKYKFIKSKYLGHRPGGPAKRWMYRYDANPKDTIYIPDFNGSYARIEVLKYLKTKGINPSEITVWSALEVEPPIVKEKVS